MREAEKGGGSLSFSVSAAVTARKMAAAAGFRASYHRFLDRIEHLLPPRLRPLYNHPAGREAAGLAAGTGDSCARVEGGRVSRKLYPCQGLQIFSGGTSAGLHR